MSFLRDLPPDGAARDAVILGAIATGNLDPVVWRKVRLGRVTLEVSADYLCIAGEHVPMAEYVAQAAVDSLGAILPTPAIVDAIEAAAIILPLPTWAPPAGQGRGAQTSSAVFALCEERTRQLFAARGLTPEQLVAGHRKDVVLARYMPPGVVVIYGARWPDGRRLQPLYPIPGGNPGHEDEYEDYSHGVRAVRDVCLLDGQQARVADLLARGMLGGPVARLRYETATATPAPTRPAQPPTTAIPSPGTATATLRRGDSGPRVVELQRLLSLAGWHTRADGVFGAITLAAVKAFQLEHGLAVDGLAGKATLAALREAAADAPPDTEPAFDLASAPLPLGDAERVRVFGSFDWVHAPREGEPGAIKILGNWVRENITTVTIPQLVGVKGCPSGRVTCHRLAAPTFQRFFAAVAEVGKMGLVLTWDGCWNPRLVRGGDSLSNHSWGVDFDINAQWNARGRPGPAAGAHGSVAELVPIAVASGLGWGGTWGTPDAMHFGALRA